MERDNGVIDDSLTYTIIGCAMKVHREFEQDFGDWMDSLDGLA